MGQHRYPFRRFAVGAGAAWLLAGGTSAYATNIEFFNDSDQVAYLSFGGDTAPQGTLTVHPSSPAGPLGVTIVIPVNSFGWQFTVQPHSKLTGLDITNYTAGKLLVSTGSPLMSTHPAFAYMGAPSGDPVINNDYNARHDKVELTIDGTSSQAANLSAADFYGLPLNVQTFKNGTQVAERGWVQSSAQLAAALAAAPKSVGAIPTGANGLPLSLSPPVVPTPGTTGVLRVIAPTTAIDSFGTSMQTYLENVQSRSIDTHVVGLYSGSIADKKPAADYDFHVTLVKDPGTGEISAHFVGTVTPRDTHVTSNVTFDLPAVDKNGRSLAKQIYLIDPAFTVNGEDYTMKKNDPITAALRDYLAGFNYGLVGSTAIDPRTGVAFKDESTDVWYSERGTPPRHLRVDEVFDAAAPCTDCYNDYAKLIAVGSDNNVYGFSFSDVLGKPLIDLNPAAVDTMRITLMPDSNPPSQDELLNLFASSFISFSYDNAAAVPEPASLAVLGLGLGLTGLARQRRRGQPRRNVADGSSPNIAR